MEQPTRPSSQYLEASPPPPPRLLDRRRARPNAPSSACVEAYAVAARVAGAGRYAFEFGRGFFDVPSIRLNVQAHACISRPERVLVVVAGSRTRDGASQLDSRDIRDFRVVVCMLINVVRYIR